MSERRHTIECVTQNDVIPFGAEPRNADLISGQTTTNPEQQFVIAKSSRPTRSRKTTGETTPNIVPSSPGPVTSRYFGSYFDVISDDAYSLSTSASAAHARAPTSGSDSTSIMAAEYAQKTGALRHVARPHFNDSAPFVRMNSDVTTTSESRAVTSNETTSSRVDLDASGERSGSALQYPYSSSLVANEQAKKLRSFLNRQTRTVNMTSHPSRDEDV